MKITQLLVLFTAVVIPLVAVQSGPLASAQTSVSETYVYVCADSGLIFAQTEAISIP